MNIITLIKIFEKIFMVSNDEIKIGLECKKEGLDPDETLEKIQVPFKWTGESYLLLKK